MTVPRTEMTTRPELGQDLDRLRHDVRALRNDLREDLQTVREDLRVLRRDGVRDVRQRIEDVQHRIEEVPVSSIVLAGIAGLGLGLAVWMRIRQRAQA